GATAVHIPSYSDTMKRRAFISKRGSVPATTTFTGTVNPSARRSWCDTRAARSDWLLVSPGASISGGRRPPRARPRHRRSELGHFREASNNRFDTRRINVHPADINHVVGAGEDATFESSPAPPTRADRRLPHDDVTRAIADHRIRRATEVRHHQLSPFPIGHGTVRCEVQHLANVLTLVQMKKPWCLEALEADRSDLGRAMMIDHTGAPLFFDPLAS